MEDTLQSLRDSLTAMDSSSAELWQYEALAASMRRLADQKRSELLSTNAATAIMDRLFSEPDAAQRAELAEGLRCETLKRLNDIRRTLIHDDYRGLLDISPIGQRLTQVYAMLNVCAGSGEADEGTSEPVTIEF